MERLKTEREKAVQHAEDLGYQVEVLRAKLHEARRSLATRPAYDSADIGYQAEQLLRNAQIQADQLRADAERELREARAQTQRILQEHAEQPGPAPGRAARRGRASAASSSTRSWPSAAQTVESHVNENVAWAEQLRARTESQARRLLDESRAEAEQSLAAARAEAAAARRGGPPAARPPRRRPARAEAEAILLRARTDAERLLNAASTQAQEATDHAEQLRTSTAASPSRPASRPPS